MSAAFAYLTLAEVEELSISDHLKALGYGHRKDEAAPYGTREVFHLSTGEVVGFFDAMDAVSAARRHAELWATARQLQAQINALEDARSPAFGPAVQALAAETAHARQLPIEEA